MWVVLASLILFKSPTEAKESLLSMLAEVT